MVNGLDYGRHSNVSESCRNRSILSGQGAGHEELLSK